MTLELLFLGSAPTVIANLWHQYLLSSRSRPHQTISQHATETMKKLLVHRLIHSMASLMLMLFAWLYLFAHGYMLAAWFLMLGAAFDILEVITLTEKSAKPVLAINYHIITAWTMAFGYIAYVMAIINTAGMSTGISWGVVVFFALLLGLAFKQKFKNFWITQHIYFCLLAVLIVLAHAQLFLAK